MIIRLTRKRTKKDVEYYPVLINTEAIAMMYPNDDGTTILFNTNEYWSIDVLEGLESIENIIRSQLNP